MNKVSIIIPVIRPDKARRCYDLIKQNAGIPESDYEIIMETDRDRIGCPEMVKQLTCKSRFGLVCFLGDDTLPQKDFLKIALESMADLPGGWGLIGLNDKSGRILPTHWLASKQLLPELDGEFFNTEYTHCFCDNELMDRCIELERYRYSFDAIVEHEHEILDKNIELDSDLKRVYSDEVFLADRKIYWRRKAKRLDKIGIGLPLAGRLCDHQFWISLLVTEKPDYILLIPSIEVYEFQKDIAEIRNDVVLQALNNGVSKLIMMDTDQVYPTDVVTKLLSHDVPVVGAPVHRRYPPFDAILYQGELHKYKLLPEDKIYSGDLVQVDATGTGCICFDTSIFIDLEPPWFELTTGPDGKPVGEDIGLCSTLREKGIKIFVDTSIAIDHLATFRVNKATREAYKALMDDNNILGAK